MAAEDSTTSPELLSQVFVDPAWLNARKLSLDTILEYFAQSPFYSKESINERASLGRLAASEAPQAGTFFSARRTGLDDRGLYVIERWLRRSETDKATLIALYYCIEGRIFQCPSVHAVCDARVSRAAFHLRKAMEHLAGAASERGAGDSAPPTAAVAASTAAFMADVQLLLLQT